MVNAYARSASRLKFDSESARDKVEGWHGGGKRQKQGGYATLCNIRSRKKRKEAGANKTKMAVSRYPAAGYGCFKTKYPAVRNF